MKRYIFLVVSLMAVVFISGCVDQKTGAMVYICQDGTRVKDMNLCSAVIESSTISTTVTSTTTTEPIAKTYNIGDVLSNELIEFTIHSARKSYYISDYSEPEDGYVYLIIDFSIKNIDSENTYSFNPYDVDVEDNNHYTYGYSWVSSRLNKYFDMETIMSGRTKRGELAFEVPKDADGFTFILKSNMWGRGLAYVYLGNIANPSETKSANLEIDTVQYIWYDYGMIIGGKQGAGSIGSIEIAIENTGNLPLIPRYDVSITYAGATIFSKTDISGILFSGVAPGKSESDTVSLIMMDVDFTGTYGIQVSVKDKGDTTILATATKNVIVS